MKARRDEGMALATAVLVLMLVSTMIVGLAWLVMSDQKLGGNTLDRQRAFYGAEGGMEALTAGIENAFNQNPAITCAQINGAAGVTANPPNQADLPGIQFLNPDGSSGYQALFNCVAGSPAASFATITTGPYAGLYAQTTPFTLQVTARSTYNSEVKLQREIQTVAIPIFQFGMFSQTDLDFFAGPNFNFGGRVHTNGNLWLAEGSGDTLTMSGKVTTAGELITNNLENGFPAAGAGGNYGGSISITTGSGFANLLNANPNQSVQGANNWVGNLGAINEPGFANVASGTYSGNVGVKETGVKVLNLAIATPGFGQNGQSIDLIRRGLQADALTFLQQRYFDMQGMGIRILLSDYGANGTCAASDLSSTSATALPSISGNAANSPVDLATLAWDTGTAVAPYAGGNIPGWAAGNVGASIFPLPISDAQGAVNTYNAGDGYWVKQGYPTITGCIKIDYQNNAGVWTDITTTVLSLGYTGRNINPIAWNGAGGAGSNLSPSVPALPGAQQVSSGPVWLNGVPTVGCTDPSPNAVIRLARERDNPSTATAASGCPNPVSSTKGTDFWPNVLYDPREGLLRDTQGALVAGTAPVAGAMYYVELDIKNLIQCITNAAICPGVAGNISSATSTGYGIYFSDRRGDRPDPNPPASIGGAGVLTGAFGYADITNPASALSCPNNALDAGEDPEGDYTSAGVDPNPLAFPRSYGNTLNPMPANLWPVPGVVGTQVTANVTNLVASVLAQNPNCPAPANVVNSSAWPYAAANTTEMRENPPIFFRRALKIVNGEALGAVANPLGVCGAGPCGLTIASENPVYIYGDYNNNPNNDATLATPNADSHVAASIVADAVTLLSDSWNDVNSFAFPYTLGNRTANVSTTYRLAIAAGKNVPFKQPGAGVVGNDFGTDGGAHNFLRYIENWGPVSLYYRGSIVSMFYSHQAYSAFKCCNMVYSPPFRGYNFDTDFQTPSKLPPLTPMLRDINTIGFTQMSLPTQ